ncbi:MULTISPECIES: hypothetical protein [Bacteroidaceae]|uniref:hypothetical protein n=1 Tax=Phocaeicola vulgatus TaxID=821 RepID=UPI0032E4E517
MPCQGILLDCTTASVYNWQQRFKMDDIFGLKTKSARQRKPLLTASDESSIRNPSLIQPTRSWMGLKRII